MGLSISRDFISMMGGTLEVQSEYGKGTGFFFTIEQRLCEEEEGKASNAQQAWKDSVEYITQNASILIVDDTEINLMIATEILKSIEAEIDTASSGEEAVEMVKQRKYDLIMMDYMMPYMDGIEASTCIRQHGFTMPIVALSGDASAETREKFINAGISDSIEKPVTPNALKKKVREWLPEELIVK